MQQDYYSLIKNVLIEYVKSHNEQSGKILDAFNHVDEALKILQSLPLDVQNEIQQGIKKALIAQGLIRNIQQTAVYAAKDSWHEQGVW